VHVWLHPLRVVQSIACCVHGCAIWEVANRVVQVGPWQWRPWCVRIWLNPLGVVDAVSGHVHRCAIWQVAHVVQKLQVCVSILLLAVVKLDAVQCISTCGGYWCCHRCRRCHRCWRHWRHWRHGCRDSHRWSWGCNRWVIGGAKGIVTSGADGCAIRQVPTIVGILVAVAHHGLEAAVVMHHDFGALGTSQDASSGGGKQSQAVHTCRHTDLGSFSGSWSRGAVHRAHGGMRWNHQGPGTRNESQGLMVHHEETDKNKRSAVDGFGHLCQGMPI